MNALSRPADDRRKLRKLLIQLGLGGVSGAAAMAGSLFFLERYEGLLDQPERVVALGTALVYGLMALVVAAGTLAPAFGRLALNVEDREELAEQRPNLLVGAVSFALAAVMLLTLTLADSAGQPGPISQPFAAIVALVAGVGSVGLSIAYRNAGDEMMRAASREASAVTIGLVFLIFGGWAAASQLGFVPMFAPLLFVSGLYALYLLAVFIVVGRKGLLAQR